MRLLCTNDDGILAYGLACLIEAAEPLGEITVVAPDREQSATSHSLTLHHPIRPIERGDRRYQVDGTPTDCVMLAVEALMPERPDFVLSGINHGQNMGEDVLYSGTVAAAMEGLSLGIPSLAVSFAGGDLRADVSMLRDQIAPLRDQANSQVMGGTLLGAGLGAALGAAVGGGRGAGIGAASGAIVGTGVGAANAQNAAGYLQQQYNGYYAQFPYRAKAGCATSTGSRRTRLAPPGMVPAVSWS